MRGFHDTPLPTGPGSLARQWHRIVRARPKNPIKVVILGQKLFGLSLHYDPEGRGSIPCLGEPACFLCEHYERRWKGYVAARYYHSLGLCVLEVTEACARALGDNPTTGNGLRGLTCSLFRKGQAPNSPVHATVERYPYADKLPEAFDVAPHLERLYGVWIKKMERIRQVSPWCPHIVDGVQIPVFPDTEKNGALPRSENTSGERGR